MGLGGSTVRYEGYGRTQHEAAQALDSLVTYHHEHASVRKEAVRFDARGSVTLYSYFVWDGQQQHPVYFDVSHGRFRAYIQL